MKRYTITLGAGTTAGGKVISASSNGSINGMSIALEGDLVFCPVCKSRGQIVCVDPRIPEMWNGKKVALANDLCRCGCPDPPRLIANQTLRYQNLEGKDANYTSESAREKGVSHVNAIEIFDEKFILVNVDTAEPMPYVEYGIRRASGHIEFGTTDGQGQTHLLAATAYAESVDLYI